MCMYVCMLKYSHAKVAFIKGISLFQNKIINIMCSKEHGLELLLSYYYFLSEPAGTQHIPC
jgi:hypothetical protein